MLNRLVGKKIELVWAPAQTLWPIKMDPSQIDQILSNLCTNAGNAISGKGRITIRTGATTIDAGCGDRHEEDFAGDFVLLTVSDNGSGMDPETLESLFEPFFTTQQSGRGTGLGLATIYGIVKQNNGFIKVDSQPQQGSIFNIYLPRYYPAEASRRIKACEDLEMAYGEE